MRKSLDFLPISGRVVFGSVGDEGGLTPGAIVGAGGTDVDLALDPLEGRGVVARGGNGAMSMIAVGEPGRLHDAARHVHAQARGRPARARLDRPAAPGRREHRGDRRGVRPPRERRDDDRPRPAAPSRPDRGDPQLGRAHQADPGRRRDRVDLGRDPRHERPPRDRHRRHAPGGALGGGAALPRRRAAGAVLADVAPRDRRAARARDRGLHARSSAPRISRRAR